MGLCRSKVDVQMHSPPRVRIALTQTGSRQDESDKNYNAYMSQYERACPDGRITAKFLVEET
jgi:hypothetical protein